MDVDLRLLRYFVVLAEELHFTRAAQRLYVSQPALSSQIRRLERRLDLVLFDRSSGGVQLTPAGVAFVPHARDALSAASLGVAAAVAAATPAEGDTLRIQVQASGLATPRMVIGALRAGLPTVALEVTSHGSTAHAERLRSGDLDLALCGARAPGGPDIAEQPVRAEPVGVALPATHRLADSAAVDLGDLAAELHYLPRDGFAPDWNDYVLAACTTAGFTPRRHPSSTDGTDTALELVRAGECVALSLVSTSPPPGCVIRPLAKHPAPYRWVLRWLVRKPIHPHITQARQAISNLSTAHSWLEG
ncbi:LysR family transcriptional regulator [Kribbella pittospori]|uniref:LysR family transcriptional regulator n=1 Tax=Kribbella pittospori TaxID=722689 RepID=A0A4R0KDX5_9ACTN|nr:LysR family transcriptional regulator [Kribbella pittospori]TCC58059.1 LysR family transcriptional regulator [Kribbella pittospori]